jgi:putative FmdB family regulatory protein
MPLYEYKCHSCGKTFEVIQKFADDALKTHLECGGEVERLFSAPAFHLKGTGWYKTDYAKKNGSEKPKSDESKSESDSKPKTETTSSTTETKAASTESKSESKSESRSKSESKPSTNT